MSEYVTTRHHCCGMVTILSTDVEQAPHRCPETVVKSRTEWGVERVDGTSVPVRDEAEARQLAADVPYVVRAMRRTIMTTAWKAAPEVTR